MTPRTAACQAPLSSTISGRLLRFISTESVMLSNCLILWCPPFSSCLQSFPASASFPMSWLFASGGQSIGASSSVSVLPVNIQGWFPLGMIGLVPCYPRDSKESSSVSKFKSINPSVLSLLYGPTVTSIHDYWKNHSLDNTDLGWQSDVSAF